MHVCVYVCVCVCVCACVCAFVCRGGGYNTFLSVYSFLDEKYLNFPIGWLGSCASQCPHVHGNVIETSVPAQFPYMSTRTYNAQRIDETGDWGLGTMLKDMNWGMPQGPVITYGEVRLHYIWV